MASLPYPVIVVPGITATYLRDEYLLPPDFPWTVMTKKFDRVALHPDDLRYESVEPARVQPDQLYEIAYRELIEELRHNLTLKADQPAPVYPFGYDWRQPLDAVEAKFEAFIDEVIDRTKLLRHYKIGAMVSYSLLANRLHENYASYSIPSLFQMAFILPLFPMKALTR